MPLYETDFQQISIQQSHCFILKGELAELEAAERIRVIQSRIYEIQKLYGKLKTELASMERRKRRKLRKQGENGE